MSLEQLKDLLPSKLKEKLTQHIYDRLVAEGLYFSGRVRYDWTKAHQEVLETFGYSWAYSEAFPDCYTQAFERYKEEVLGGQHTQEGEDTPVRVLR